MTLPAGFHDHSSTEIVPADHAKTVHRLLKGVPGIPQGSHLWYKKATEVITGAGMERIKDDYAVFRVPGLHIYLATWVDDFFLFHTTDEKTRGRAEQIQKYLQFHLDLPKTRYSPIMVLS